MMLASWLVAADPPPAAPDAPPDLRTLKAGLRKDLLTAVLPGMKAHRQALLAFEQKRATAQDFSGAIKARDERLKLEKQIGVLEQEAAILASRPAIQNAARLLARIELKLVDAKLTELQRDPTDGALTGWGNENASATWQLPALPPGGYEVLVRCTGPSGEIVVRETFYNLKKECKPTGDKSLEQNLGTLRISEGAGSVTLSAAAPEKSSDWRVYSIVLVPSAI
jgi:hypothetical protein